MRAVGEEAAEVAVNVPDARSVGRHECVARLASLPEAKDGTRCTVSKYHVDELTIREHIFITGCLACGVLVDGHHVLVEHCLVALELRVRKN
jgi:hypothetical protein